MYKRQRWLTAAAVAVGLVATSACAGSGPAGPPATGADDRGSPVTFVAIGRIGPRALTSELSIRFLRPAQGERIWARADLATATRRSVVGSVSVWMDDRSDRPTAVAQGTYVLPRAKD